MKPQDIYVYDVEARVVSIFNLMVIAQAASGEDYEFGVVFPGPPNARAVEVHYKDRRGSSISAFYPTWKDAQGRQYVVLQAKKFEVLGTKTPKWEHPWEAFAPMVEAAKYALNRSKGAWEKQS